MNNIINKDIIPNSSPITLTIKSDSWTGKNFNWVWVPSPNPLPKNPPEPKAVLLWIIWYPAPSGSSSGFKNVRILFLWNGLRKFQKRGNIRPKKILKKKIVTPFQSLSIDL